MDDILDFIRVNEGFRAKPYRCPAGKWTIGYGYNMEARGIPSWMVDAVLSGKGISKEQANQLLMERVAQCLKFCERLIPGWSGLNRGRQIAFTDMCFNLGNAGLAKFKRMLVAVGNGDWDAAANEAMKSKWYQQVGLRGVRVVKLIREG